MYRCKDCGRNFDYPQKIKEKDDEMLTISRVYFVCPECGSDNITENIIRYCKCCGRSLGTNKKDYCSIVCRKQGEKLYEQQRKKYIHIKSSPIYETARMLDKYNKEHNIVPKTIKKEVRDIIEIKSKKDIARAQQKGKMSASERNLLIEQMQKEMKAAANMLDFERAAYLRDAIAKIKNPE